MLTDKKFNAIIFYIIVFNRRAMTEVQEFNELLRKINSDAEAKEIFWLKYYSLLKSHVKLKYGDFPDWEDIVHDVVNKIISTDWTGYPYIDSPVSWLYTIADNHAKDVFKKVNRICDFKEETYSDFNIEYIAIRNDVRNAMRHLKRETQYILYAYYWLGKELYTIAKEIGKSYVSVRVTILRARKLLKKYL